MLILLERNFTSTAININILIILIFILNHTHLQNLFYLSSEQSVNKAVIDDEIRIMEVIDATKATSTAVCLSY